MFRTATRRPAVRAALALAGLTVPAVFALAVLAPSSAAAAEGPLGDVVTSDEVKDWDDYTEPGQNPETETPTGDETATPEDEETKTPEDEETHTPEDEHWDDDKEEPKHEYWCYDPEHGEIECDYQDWQYFCSEHAHEYPQYCEYWEDDKKGEKYPEDKKHEKKKYEKDYKKDYEKKDHEKDYKKDYKKDESLPVTGASLPAVAIAAVVLLLLGVLTLVVSARRRRRAY